MTNRNLMAMSALALGLTISASASAQPYGKGGNYSMAPEPRPAAEAHHNRGHRTANCDCPMMSGGAAMQDQCMQMMGRDHGQQGPGSAG